MISSNLTSPLSINDVLGGLPETACVTPFGIIDLLNPKESDVDISFIAQALSRIPRFNGLTGNNGAYPVALHCVIGAEAIYNVTEDKKLALRFLLHDAHEAFLSDIPRPVQKCFGSDFSERLETITNKWDEVIYQKFGLTSPRSFLESINADLASEMDCLLQQYEYEAFFCKYENKPLISRIGVFDKPAFMPVISPIELFNKPEFTETIRLGLAETWPSVVAEDRFLACLLRYT